MNANINEILKEVASDLCITKEEAYLLMLMITKTMKKEKEENEKNID